MATAIVAVRVRENQSVAENLLNINPNFAKLAHRGLSNCWSETDIDTDIE